MQKLNLFLLSAVYGRNELPFVSFDDVDIPEANRALNYRDGDIRREFEDTNTRSTINDEFFRWKLPIPIVMSSQMGLKARGEYKQAMIEYGLRTCVPFVPWTGEDDFISIYPMSGCWSYVGQGQC